VKRIIAIAAVVAATVVIVPTAAASDTSDTTTAPPVTTTPVTEVPVTTTPVTTTPVTTTPATTTVTEVPTTTTLPSTTSIPTTGTESPCIADCIPTADGCADCIPTAGGAYTPTVGSGALPFTGIGDMVAPILLALTVVLGGVVAWRWAQLRESVAQAASRARPLPARETRSGYAAAMRSHDIERRARQVFTPRVA